MKILFPPLFKVKKFNSNLLIKDNVGVSTKVRCYDRETGELLSQTVSDINGDFILQGSSINSNYILSVDFENKYNIVVQDNITG